LPFLLLRNGFRSIEKTDQLRTEKITHPQNNQQNFARIISKFTTTLVICHGSEERLWETLSSSTSPR
jgi:hypothetical protein